jgi:hypothetical protein
MDERRKILFIIGSLNQTTQMHQIALQLPDFDCYFSQIFDTRLIVQPAYKLGFFEQTIFSGHFKRNSEKYLEEYHLPNDYRMEVYNNDYALVVLCSDMVVPKNIRRKKTIWIQEGMTDPYTILSRIVRATGLPPYLAMNTSLNGSTNICDIYCAASEGYKKQFARLGTDARKIVVTGIPNFDNARQYLNNNFPYKDFVLVATTDTRETLKPDNRKKFIRKCVKIANGRQLIFKLHPNENAKRATREVMKYAPDALVFTSGNINHMIANCVELITQYSSCVYIGIALGKKVYSNFDVDRLYKLAPVQNGGISAKNIADICRGFVNFEGSGVEYLSHYPEANNPQQTKQKISLSYHEYCHHHPGAAFVNTFAR